MFKNFCKDKNLFVTSLITVASIFIYGFIKARWLNNFDILQFKLGLWDFDGWSLTHLVFYFMLTHICPQKWKIIFIAGVMWEVIESAIGTPGMITRNMHLTDPKDKVWWYGKVSDIVINTIGIMIALVVSQLRK